MARVILLLLFFSVCRPLFSQTARIDQLKARLQVLPPDSRKERLEALLALCKEKYSLSGDTLCAYSARAMKLAEEINHKPHYYEASNFFAWGLMTRGQLDSCEKYISPLLDLLKENSRYRPQYIRLRITYANNLYKKNRPNLSLKNMYELLQEVKDTPSKIDILNEIAVAYGGMEHFEKEIEWANRSLALNRNPQTREEKSAYIRALSNKSIAFIHLYEQARDKVYADSCIQYATEALNMARENEILLFYCQSLILTGYYYSYMNEPEKAEYYLKKGVEVRKMGNEPIFIVSDLTVLGTFYATTGQPDKGIEVCREALRICREKKLGFSISTLAYKALCQNYEAAGDQQALAATLRQLLKVKDSLYLQNLDGEIEKLDAVYNLQKQEIELARKEASLDKKNFQFYTILITAAFLAISAGIWFNGYNKTRKMELRYVQEEEKRKAELAVKEAEENERKRLAADLHDHLGVQANVILHTAEQLRADVQVDAGLIGHLNDSAKDMLFFLRETLWALKSADVSAENVWLRILNFIARMKRTYTPIRFEISGTPPAGLLLPSAKALNILMIIQEAVNNSARHSGGTVIRIVSEPETSCWRLCVTDNGTGFSPGKMEGESYGLSNMRQRSESSGFRFELVSHQGTRTLIEIPLV